MIIEDYVSFEVAKLLKEKGFYQDFFNEITPVWKLNNNKEELAFYGDDNYPCEWEEWYSAPTFQTACKWLREVHKIHIETFVTYKNKISHYQWRIECLNNQDTIVDNPCCSTYEEAVEAAIKYCLENLI